MAVVTTPEFWLVFNLLVYFLMNGAQIFETFVFVPKWSGKTPESLKLLLDKPGIPLKTFWTVFHALHEVIFIITIIICRNNKELFYPLLILFFIHFSVRVWTILYFAPKIILFQNIAADKQNAGTDIAFQIKRWKQLNIVRVMLFILISLALIPFTFHTYFL